MADYITGQFYQIKLSEDLYLNENTWNHLSNQRERPHVLRWLTSLLQYLQVSQSVTSNRKKTNGVIAFSCRSIPDIFKYRDYRWDFTTIWKIRFLRTHLDIRYLNKQPPQIFYKKVVLKIFAIFTGKHLCWSLLLIKLWVCRSATSLKTDSNKGVALWIMWNF